MNKDGLNEEMKNMAQAGGIELSDEGLDGIAGGFIYHDRGNVDTHRQESYYVIDGEGTIVMRLDDADKARRWAGNLRTSQQLISASEFEKLRKPR